MVHSCRFSIAADGCNYTEIIAISCEMPEMERRDKPNGEERTDTRGKELVFVQINIKTRFRFFGSFYSFFVQIKNDSGLVRCNRESALGLEGERVGTKKKRKEALTGQSGAPRFALVSVSGPLLATSQSSGGDGGVPRHTTPEYTI